MFNATFNNISAISRLSVLLIQETGVKPSICRKSPTNFINKIVLHEYMNYFLVHNQKKHILILLLFFTEKVPTFTSQRFILAYMFFMGYFNIYAVRVNLSVAIVCMVRTPVYNQTLITSSYDNVTQGNQCGTLEERSLKSNEVAIRIFILTLSPLILKNDYIFIGGSSGGPSGPPP